jgi:hypothetical protein
MRGIVSVILRSRRGQGFGRGGDRRSAACPLPIYAPGYEHPPTEAQGLYKRLGFRTIQPYYELPDELRAWLVFMELKLA